MKNQKRRRRKVLDALSTERFFLMIIIKHHIRHVILWFLFWTKILIWELKKKYSMLDRLRYIDVPLTDEKSETSKKRSSRCFINQTVLPNINNQVSYMSCNFLIFIARRNSYLRDKKEIFDAWSSMLHWYIFNRWQIRNVVNTIETQSRIEDFSSGDWTWSYQGSPFLHRRHDRIVKSVGP